MVSQKRLHVWRVFWSIAPFLILIALLFVGIYLCLPLAIVLMLLVLIPCYHAVKFWLEKTNDASCMKSECTDELTDITIWSQRDDMILSATESTTEAADQDDKPPSYEEVTLNEVGFHPDLISHSWYELMSNIDLKERYQLNRETKVFPDVHRAYDSMTVATDVLRLGQIDYSADHRPRRTTRMWAQVAWAWVIVWYFQPWRKTSVDNKKVELWSYLVNANVDHLQK